MKTGRRLEGYRGTGRIFDPMEIPLSELIQIERGKIQELDLSAEPQVSVSWSESDDLLPMAAGDFKINFCPMLAKNAERCGYTKLRPVQRAIVPFVNNGSNVCIATGGCSGKTVGYLLPVIQNVYNDLQKHSRKDGYPRALIVTPTREKAKHTFNLLRMLTDGLGINICLSIIGMDTSHYLTRDKSDITIMTHRSLFTLLENGRRMNLGYLISLILEGVDDMHVNADFRVCWVQEILSHYDEEARGAQLITVVEDISFLDSEICQERVFRAHNTVVIDNGDRRLSPSNHTLLRVNRSTMSQALLKLVKNYDKGKVVIVFNPSERQLIEKEVMAVLDGAGIPYFCFRRGGLEMSERTEIQRRFARGERQVLVTPYARQIRCLRFPGIRQIIHVEPPFETHEGYDESYNHSASCVAFKKEARSVVFFHVDNNCHARHVEKVAESIRNCQTEGWPRNCVPEWAADFGRGKRSWNEEDRKAAEELWDLEETFLVPSESNFGANDQPSDHVDQGRGYCRDMDQNRDYGANPQNAVDSSFVSSPSPAPIGDVNRSYSQTENHSQYSSPPQQRYAYREEVGDPQNSMGNTVWNDRHGSNRSSQKGGPQTGSRFEKPAAFEYDDFEEDNIGFREFRNSGCSSSRVRDRIPSSSSYDCKERYYQDDYLDSRDGSHQDRQEFNNFGRQKSCRAQGASREFQQSSYKNEFPDRQMMQNNAWDGPRMGQRQGGRQEATYQNWQTDNHQPNRQVQGQENFRRNEPLESGSMRGSGRWNQEEQHGGRQAGQYHGQRADNQIYGRGKYGYQGPPSPRDATSLKSNWSNQERQEQRGNQLPSNQFVPANRDGRGGGVKSQRTEDWSQGNARRPRNQFVDQNREDWKTRNPNFPQSSQNRPTGSWNDDSDLPKDLWPKYPNKCIPGQKPSIENRQQSSWDDKIDSSEDDKAEPKWSDWKVSDRTSADEKHETPIMGAISDAEEQW